jgi:WD40 repeat protein
MANVVCQVINRDDRMEFIWSARGGFFEPYAIEGPDLSALRDDAAAARVALEALVTVRNERGSPEDDRAASRELAEAGYRLFYRILPFFRDRATTSRAVRGWLRGLHDEPERTSLEVVVEETAAVAADECRIPWNLVYDTDPDDAMAAPEGDDDRERWRPFWGIRYDLTCGRRVEPLRRRVAWADPRVVVVVDPPAYARMHEDQRRRIDDFLAARRLERVETIDGLKRALREGQPRLLYWLGHARPEYLCLGDGEKIAPRALEGLLIRSAGEDLSPGMLVFLNACRTGEAGREDGSFSRVLKDLEFCRGAILTERETIDNFANGFGLDFLEGFLDRGESVGELLHRLRLEHAPLGLIYGAYCPPEIHVVVGPGPRAEAPPELAEVREARGILLGAEVAAPAGVDPPAMPEEPYRSLAYFDESARLLFTGRDADIVRFAATLDRPDTRILILHGESGTGKSSFLRAGVIPYLQGECVGYRFLRDAAGEVVTIQAAKDPVGGLAVGLLEMTEVPQEYRTPSGELRTIALRPVLDEALGAPADAATLRTALMADEDRLATLLERMSARLPHALLLIIDQAEELFTLARTPEETAARDQALRLIRRVADVRADVKVIVSLRTEYYGRLLDHLRDGRRDQSGIRDDLLRDFSRSALIEAIERPTLESPLAEDLPSPRATYRFTYADGVAAAIADGVLRLRSENRDSVLPLVQVICTRLYKRASPDPAWDRVVTAADLEAIGGVEGGLKAFAEDTLSRSMGLDASDQNAFKATCAPLCNLQADGTLTTWLAPRARLEEDWRGSRPFGEVLGEACAVRLLREDVLRIEGGEPRSYVRLGHDALAEVVGGWRQELAVREGRRKLIIWAAAAAILAVVMGGLSAYALRQKLAADEQKRVADASAAKAQSNEAAATKAREDAEEQRERATRTAVRLMVDRAAAIQREGDSHKAALTLAHGLEEIARTNDRAMNTSIRTMLSDFWSRGHDLRTILAPPGRMLAAAFSPDGRLLAMGGADGMARMWDVATGSPVGAPLQHPKAVRLVRFSPDSKVLVTTCRDMKARRWGVPGGQPIGGPMTVAPDGFIEWMHEKKVVADIEVVVGPDGADLVTICGYPLSRFVVRRWAATAGDPIKEIILEMSYDVAVSPDGRTALPRTLAADDGPHRLWDLVAGRTIGRPIESGSIRVATFSPDGKIVATGGHDLTARLWDAATGRPIGEPLKHEMGRKGMVEALVFSPDGKTLLTTSKIEAEGGGTILFGRARKVRLWDVATGKPLSSIPDDQYETRPVFGPDGRTFLTQSGESEARLWETATGKPIGDPLRHDAAVNGVTFSRDGEVVATYGPSVARLWDAATGRPRARPLRHPGTAKVTDVTFSPDDRLLLTHCDDDKARLWEVATGWSIGNPIPYQDGGAAIFSPDGRTLAIWGTASTVTFHDTAAGNPIGPALECGLFSAFRPDGKTWLTLTRDGTLRERPTPGPLGGTPEQIRVWLQSATGMDMDEEGNIRFLDASSWLENRKLLDKLGEPQLTP